MLKSLLFTALKWLLITFLVVTAVFVAVFVYAAVTSKGEITDVTRISLHRG